MDLLLIQDWPDDITVHVSLDKKQSYSGEQQQPPLLSLTQFFPYFQKQENIDLLLLSQGMVLKRVPFSIAQEFSQMGVLGHDREFQLT